jgi:alkylated DNA repair dioxygenase AlkB
MDVIQINKSKKVKGLYYIDNAINSNDSDPIIDFLDKQKWSHVTDSVNSRKVQHYGYKYDYNTGTTNISTDPIPNILLELRDYLSIICEYLNIHNTFNQCIVNNYMAGQGIGKHIDSKSYGDVIGCFTIGSGATMRFTRGENGENGKYIKYVEPNSLYIMSEDARYIWKHEMTSVKKDIVNGEKIDRGRRISITFRYVK